jgi:methionyl-tRNA synthetase
MPKKIDTEDERGYVCEICGAIYSLTKHGYNHAVSCEESHKVVYVKFYKEDLFKLYMFLMSGDESLLTESLMKTLTKYSRGYYT